MQDAYDLLNAHRADYIAGSSRAEFEKALHSARIVIQSVQYGNNLHNNYLRDQFMAENAAWIVDQAEPGAKMVLWAHNGHVGMNWEGVAGTYRTMGSFLHEQYGEQMVVFGFLFYQGSFHAFGPYKSGSINDIQTFQAPEPPSDSYVAVFHASGMPRFFVDMRLARSNPSSQEWFQNPHPFFMAGSVYDPNNPQFQFQNAALAKAFDVIIYLQDTTPSILVNQ
jgi:erythromycin esterase